jgi:hypothetical protein
MGIFDDVRFWSQVLADQQRTVICHPELESRVKTMVDAYGVSGTVKVLTCEYLPSDRIVLMDEGALEASIQKVLQRGIGGRRGP